MGCIKPPANVTEPPARSANRLAFRNSTATPQTPAKAESRTRGTVANESGRQAATDMKAARTTAQLDDALAKARVALNAALSKASSPTEKQSIRNQLRDIEKKAYESRRRIELEECLEAGFPRHVVTASATSTPTELAEGYALVGSKPRSSEYAGAVFPKDEMSADVAAKYSEPVRFTTQGFPDFTPFAIATVSLDNLTGSRTKDFRLADAAAGLTTRPAGYTWHHAEDGHTLVLVPTDLHGAVPHTGGIARDQNIKGLQQTIATAIIHSMMDNESAE